MGHHHDHGHGHCHAPATFDKAFAWAVGLNTLFTFIEALYALNAHSMSLLADAGHNLGDVLGLLMAWGASWLLKRPGNKQYSYGYKRTTILAALGNALLLVFASALIVHESIYRLIHPVLIDEKIVMLIAFIGIFINGFTAMLFMKGSKDDLNIKAAFWHLASDALISLGVVIAGAVILYTGWLWLDPFVGILITVVILLGTWGLLRDSVRLIMDAVPSWINQDDVLVYLQNIPGVAEVHDLHIWGLSTTGVALTAHLIMPDESLNDEKLREIRYHLSHEYNIEHSTIQVEKGVCDTWCVQ